MEMLSIGLFRIGDVCVSPPPPPSSLPSLPAPGSNSRHPGVPITPSPTSPQNKASGDYHHRAAVLIPPPPPHTHTQFSTCTHTIEELISGVEMAAEVGIIISTPRNSMGVWFMFIDTYCLLTSLNPNIILWGGKTHSDNFILLSHPPPPLHSSYLSPPLMSHLPSCPTQYLGSTPINMNGIGAMKTARMFQAQRAVQLIKVMTMEDS